MNFCSRFFVFFIAIIWLCFFFECSNGTGNYKVPKNVAKSSPNQGPTSDNKASDSVGPLENDWDVEFCHKELKITNNKELKITKLILECDNKKNGSWRSVFAKYPISLNKDSTGLFYFEMKKLNSSRFYFGFAEKQKENLGKKLWHQKHTYAYTGGGDLYINGSKKDNDNQHPINKGDVAGIGVNLYTREIFFTKNGSKFASNYSSLSPSSSIYQLFPFVTLTEAGTEIESNFGQNDFKFTMPESEVPIYNLPIESSRKFLDARGITSQENVWDATACEKGLEIIGGKSLTVYYNRIVGRYRLCVFAKHPILLSNSSDFLYFEITVKKLETDCLFGFAVKQQKNEEDKTIFFRKGTYAYWSNREIWINGNQTNDEFKYNFGVGDVVGCGVNLANRQIIFTKNGCLLVSSNLLDDKSSAVDKLFPFVSLHDHDDEITANFGSEEFKFNQKSL